MVESAQQTTVEVFEATSRDEYIIVSVDRQGASVGVQLEPEAMDRTVLPTPAVLEAAA